MRAALIGLAAAGFGVGAVVHAVDFVRYGWWPYRFGPPALTLFWNALLPLDLVVIVLLIVRPRAGIITGIVLMVVDVAANLYARRVLDFDGFALAVPLQAAFLGLLILMAPVVVSLSPDSNAR